MQFDPLLKTTIRRYTGRAWDARPGGAEIPVVAWLRADAEVPGLRVVARFGDIVTGRVAAAAVGDVRAHPAVASLKAARQVLPALVRSTVDVGVTRMRRDPALAVGGAGVIVAVADWHCDFAHANFRRADGSTRVCMLWDQRDEPSSRSPAPFGYGTVWTAAELDAALAQDDPYAALGYDPAPSDPYGEGSHGTHVLDIAAGNGRAPGAVPGMAPDAELAFVHLRGDDTDPLGNLGDSVRVLEAARFVFDCAGATPTVLNLSLGTHGGPHDGTTLVERALDELVAERPGRAITMSTGNYFRGCTHSAGSIAQGEEVVLAWEFRGRRRGPSELELWYERDDELHVELWAPDGTRVLALGQGDDGELVHGARPLVTGHHRTFDPTNGCHHVDLFLWPGAPIGTWRVRIVGTRIERGRWDAWVEREGRGRQSRLALLQSVVTSTTGSICNGRRTIAVGAYDARQRERPIVGFSSCGPTRDGRRKPDLVAPGAGIVAARSTFVPGPVRSMDGLVAKSGTSMAAPHVCGAIALMFASALPHRLTIDETRDILFSTVRPPPRTDPITRMRYGRGLLDAHAAVRRVRSQLSDGRASTPRKGEANDDRGRQERRAALGRRHA